LLNFKKAKGYQKHF